MGCSSYTEVVISYTIQLADTEIPYSQTVLQYVVCTSARVCSTTVFKQYHLQLNGGILPSFSVYSVHVVCSSSSMCCSVMWCITCVSSTYVCVCVVSTCRPGGGSVGSCRYVGQGTSVLYDMHSVHLKTVCHGSRKDRNDDTVVELRGQDCLSQLVTPVTTYASDAIVV